MFGRIALARAQLAARRGLIDYEERVEAGERFLFARCRLCGERLAGVSLSRYDVAAARRRLRFSVEQHLRAGCPLPPTEQPGQRGR